MIGTFIMFVIDRNIIYRKINYIDDSNRRTYLGFQ